MKLNHLRYVKAVAETSSFTLAAEQCYVTQPTLSNGINQLEQELEERIFLRTTRRVALTSFGEHLLPFIEKVLESNDDLVREARSFVHPHYNGIRIGTSPLVDPEWLAPMLENFRKCNADIEIILHEQNMADLYRMLHNGILDFVFGVADTHKASWASTFLYREPLYFIPRGVNYPDAGNSISFEKIAGETYVMVPSGCGLARATRALFRSYRRKLNEYSGEALSYQVLEQWATLGLGAAILPKSKIISSERKTYLLVDKTGKKLELDFEAVWLNTASHQEHLQQFAAFLVKQR